jgi:hypothetical protein
MQKLFFMVLMIGSLAAHVSAQGPAPAPAVVPRGQPSAEPPAVYGTTSYPGFAYSTNSGQQQPRQLIERWKAAQDSNERDKVEATLRETLKSEFAVRLAAHEREIKELEEKIRQLRNRLNLRREKQDEIVDHRLQQVLRDAQGLGWGTDGMGGQSLFHSPYQSSSQRYAPSLPSTTPRPADTQDLVDSEAVAPAAGASDLLPDGEAAGPDASAGQSSDLVPSRP